MSYRKEIKKLRVSLPADVHYIIEQNFGGADYKKAVWMAGKIFNACYAIQKEKDGHTFDIEEQKMPMRVSKEIRKGWSGYNYDAIKKLIDAGKLSQEILELYDGNSDYFSNQYSMYGYRWEIMRLLPFVAISSYTFSAVVGNDYKRLLIKLEALGLITVFIGSEAPENPNAKYPRIYLWSHNLPETVTTRTYLTKTLMFQDDGVCWRAYLQQENALAPYIVANPNVRYVVNDLYKIRLSEEFVDDYINGGGMFLMEQFADDYERKSEKKYFNLKPAEKKAYPTLQAYREKYTLGVFMKDIADDMALLSEYRKTPRYAKHRYISTCKAQRIYSPLCSIYSGLRPFLRTAKIKQMASIDLKASIPTILAEKMHRAAMNCEFTKLIADHQDIYVVMMERLGLRDRNEAKKILNTCINSQGRSRSFQKLTKVFPEVAEYILGSRQSFEIPDAVKEDIRRWEIQNSRGAEKYKPDNKPTTPYQQYYLRDKRGVQDGDYLWENTISIGSFIEKNSGKNRSGRQKKHLVPINTSNKIHSLTYRELFTFESQLMQKIVARIKRSNIGDETDVLLLHDAIYFNADNAFSVQYMVESVVKDAFTLCCPEVEVEYYGVAPEEAL